MPIKNNNIKSRVYKATKLETKNIIITMRKTIRIWQFILLDMFTISQ